MQIFMKTLKMYLLVNYCEVTKERNFHNANVTSIHINNQKDIKSAKIALNVFSHTEKNMVIKTAKSVVVSS
jgi:hypothetical protein